MRDQYIGLSTDTLATAPPELLTVEEVLWELRRRMSRTERGRYAAVALDELTAGACEPPTEGSERDFHRSALTHAAIEPLIVPMLELARESRAKPWCDLVLRLLDLVPVPLRKPSQVLRLALQAPRAVRPVLLADYWHLLMTGSRHDPARILPIALDVWGADLASPPRLLAETLLAVGRRDIAESPWRPFRRGGDPTAPLEVLAAIPDELDFVRGWGLVRLRPLLEDNGLEEKALALARRLSDRFDVRADTLRRWARPAPAEPPLPAAHGESRDAVTALSVPCDSRRGRRRFRVYVGRPAPGYHPLHFQAARIREAHGAVLSEETLDRVRTAAGFLP